MAHDIRDNSMTPLAKGMVNWIKNNLVANSVLVQDAYAGDTQIMIDSTRRFDKFDEIVLMDDDAYFDSTTNRFMGVEFCTISEQPNDVNVLYLSSPLSKDFLVSKNGRMQKAIAHAILERKDVLYGDREVIGADFVAICVEPEAKTTEWLALQLLGAEYRMSILVYVKSGGTSLDEENFPTIICHQYADAIENMLNNQLHIDLCVDEVPLRADACAGDCHVVIGSGFADQWGACDCCEFQVQDVHGVNQMLKIVPPHSSSSSDSTCIGCYESSSSLRSESSLSSEQMSTSSRSESSASSDSSSESSMTSSSTSTPSESTVSSASITTSSSTSSKRDSSVSSSSQTSSESGSHHTIFLNRGLNRNFRVRDKAVLRRVKRYIYDSRVDRVTYGDTQKGSAMLKAAKISWFGKEGEVKGFPQVGRG